MEKYIIYKSTGGLAHSLRGLSDMIKLAKKHKRILMIDYIKCIFDQNFSDWFYIDDKELKYTTNYDTLPNNLSYKGIKKIDIENKPLQYSNEKYMLNGNNLSKIDLSERLLIVAGTNGKCCIDGNIKVKKNVKKNIINSIPKVPEKYIGVHFRNTDKYNNENVCFKTIEKCVKLTQITTIYIATDDFKFFDVVCNKFPELNFFRYVIPYDTYGKGLHKFMENKEKMLNECLTDIYVLLKCSFFVPSINSGLSKMILGMRKNKKNIFNEKCNFKTFENLNNKKYDDM